MALALQATYCYCRLRHGRAVSARAASGEGPDVGHDHATGRLRRSLGGDLTAAGAILGTYASEDHVSDYFGIDADNVARSGLDRYDADAGFKDAGMDLVLGFGQGPGWQASLVGRYRRLLDDAADSPIVDDEGNENQFFAGLLAGYRF